MKIKQWTKFEKIWLISFATIILATTIIFSFSGTDYTSTKSIVLNWFVSPISALTGIVCVVLVAKGKISNYAWGLINAISYAYLAYVSGYYGDMVLNIFWFIPTQLIGFLFWKKMLKSDSKTDVKMKKMNIKQILIILAIGIIGTILFGMVLENVDHWFTNIMQRNESIYLYFEQIFGIKYLGSMLDASTEILQITATVLMILAFAEQWLLWIVTNVITIIMWLVVIIADPSSMSWAMPTLIMWIAYLINSVYGYVNWIKGAKENV